MDLGHLGLQSQLSLLSRTSAVNCLRILHLVRTTILVVPSTCPLGSWAKKWEICAYHNNTNLFIFTVNGYGEAIRSLADVLNPTISLPVL